MLKETLKENPVFACLGHNDLDSVTKSAINKSYHEGEWIAHHGQSWPFLFLIKDGVVQALKEFDKSTQHGWIHPCEWFVHHHKIRVEHESSR